MPDGYNLTNYQGGLSFFLASSTSNAILLDDNNEMRSQGNGGFTLRRRVAVMSIIENYPMNEVEKGDLPEDVWYHSKYLVSY